MHTVQHKRNCQKVFSSYVELLCLLHIFARNGTLFGHFIGNNPVAMVTAGPNISVLNLICGRYLKSSSYFLRKLYFKEMFNEKMFFDTCHLKEWMKEL